MSVALYKIGGVHFLLLGSNAYGFHVKAQNERFTVASSRWRQNLKCSPEKISRRRLADYIKTFHQQACSTIIFLHSTNQINGIDLWRCRWRRQILIKTPYYFT